MQAMARLMRATETVKQLSDHPFARIQDRLNSTVNPSIWISRLRRHHRQFIEETLGVFHIALESTGLTGPQVDEIFWSGAPREHLASGRPWK